VGGKLINRTKILHNLSAPKAAQSVINLCKWPDFTPTTFLEIQFSTIHWGLNREMKLEGGSGILPHREWARNWMALSLDETLKQTDRFPRFPCFFYGFSPEASSPTRAVTQTQAQLNDDRELRCRHQLFAVWV
jgi:hypothetical protein